MSKQDFTKEFSVRLHPDENTEVVLDNSDIHDLYFIEDLYSYMITGKLVFTDNKGIMEINTVVSGVKIDIIYGEEKIFEISFSVYKINWVAPVSSNNSTDNIIELVFADNSFQMLINQKFSKSWQESEPSEIITNIWNNMIIPEDIQQGEVEDTNYKIDFVSPWWTPAQMINWLLLRSKSDIGWGYINYCKIDHDQETIVWNLKTMESLLNQSSLANDVGDGLYVTSSDKPYEFNKILSYEMTGMDMFSVRSLRGGHMLGYDFKRHKILNEVFQYSGTSNSNNTTSDKFTMLGRWTLMHPTSDSSLDDTLTNFTLTGESDEELIKNIYYNDWIKKYCVQNTMNIIVRGHESRQIGSLVELQWPTTYKNEQYNENLSGVYLIKNITHHFTTGTSPTYIQKIGLMKNAYNYEAVSNSVLKESDNINSVSNRNLI